MLIIYGQRFFGSHMEKIEAVQRCAQQKPYAKNQQREKNIF
jgi:hypothetical protein